MERRDKEREEEKGRTGEEEGSKWRGRRRGRSEGEGEEAEKEEEERRVSEGRGCPSAYPHVLHVPESSNPLLLHVAQLHRQLMKLSLKTVPSIQ